MDAYTGGNYSLPGTSGAETLRTDAVSDSVTISLAKVDKCFNRFEDDVQSVLNRTNPHERDLVEAYVLGRQRGSCRATDAAFSGAASRKRSAAGTDADLM